jgi:alpha-amylase
MVDVVANHMGNAQKDVSMFSPFNRPEHYHDYCLIKNYNDQKQVEYCRIGSSESSLADLDTENEYVINELNHWIGTV